MDRLRCCTVRGTYFINIDVQFNVGEEKLWKHWHGGNSFYVEYAFEGNFGQLFEKLCRGGFIAGARRFCGGPDVYFSG